MSLFVHETICSKRKGIRDDPRGGRGWEGWLINTLDSSGVSGPTWDSLARSDPFLIASQTDLLLQFVFVTRLVDSHEKK